MNGIGRSQIDEALAAGSIRWREHRIDRMRERGLRVADLVDLLRHGDLIEQDPGRRPFPTAVLRGHVGTRALHVVVGWQPAGAVLHVITVYDPDLAHFEAGMSRRRR